MNCTACSHANERGTVVCRACGADIAAAGIGASARTGAARPAIDVGAVRIAFAGAHGARIETATDRDDEWWPPRPAELPPKVPALDVRPQAEQAVWDRLPRGALVRIQGESGCGATTLLARLAAAASDHGFTDGAVLVTGVRGPFGDVAQCVAARLDRQRVPRRYAAPELERIGDEIHSLVLLDRVELSAAEAARLGETFPNCGFVVAGCLDGTAAPDGPAIVLDALAPDRVVALLEASYRRHIDAENRRAALELCASAGSLPGPVRLIGTAARLLQRSFVSLQLAYDTGGAVIHAFLANLLPAERRILGILALAGAPLSAHHVAYVVRSAEIRAQLDHLSECALVHACGSDMYDLPRLVEPLVPPLDDADAAFARIVHVVCDTLDSWQAVPVLDRQLSAAESLLARSAQRARWNEVLALGPRLADMFALRGAFGAWGRVLRSVEAAAAAAGDAAALGRARHDDGVRTTILGEAGEPVMTSAAREPHAEVLALPRRRPVRNWLMAGAALVAVALLAFALARRPVPVPVPMLTEFSAHPASIAAGRSTQICVAADDVAVIEVFPIASRLPGSGRQCLRLQPAASTTYVAVGTAPNGGRVQRSLRVEVRSAELAAPRIAGFSLSPARIRVGQTAQLCYAVTSARELRIAPRIGDLTRLRACRTLTFREPRRYRYTLAASGENGRVAVEHAQVDVIASAPRSNRAAARKIDDEGLPRRSIYQFDATPSVVARGQATSLCAGIDRTARGFVTHVGPLQSGITRCYRVLPRATTVYRLYVAAHHASTVEMLTVAVRPAPRRRDVARDERR